MLLFLLGFATALVLIVAVIGFLIKDWEPVRF